jgi:PAS domain S-box-containing protein
MAKKFAKDKMKTLKLNKIHISKIAGVFIIAAGCMVVGGCWFGITAFKVFLTGSMSIKFNTALCFILSGISLYLINLPVENKKAKAVSCIISGIVIFTGLIYLLEHLMGYKSVIDEPQLKQVARSFSDAVSDRMNIGAAIYFVSFGFILLALSMKKLHRLVQGLLGVMLPGVLLVIISHLFGDDFLSSLPQLKLTSLPTAILFTILFIGVLFSKPFGYLRFSFQHKIAAFFFLLSLVLIIMFYAFKLNRDQGLVSNYWIKHSYETLLTAELLNTNANQIQSAARGYFLTGDESLIKNVKGIDSLIDDNIRQLRFFATENPGQLIRIDSLQQLIYTYRELLNNLILVRRAEGLEVAREAFLKCKGRAVFEEIRSIINITEKEENKMILAHKNSNEVNIQNSSRAILLFQIIAGFLLLYSFWIILKNTRLRNKAEAKLKKSLKDLSDYKYALNQSSMVVITDQHGVIKQVNDNLCKISKYPRRELIGQNHSKLNLSCNSGELLSDLEMTMASGRVWKGELKNIASDGTYYWKDTTIIPFLDSTERPYQFVAVSSDITCRKALEAEIKQINSELQQRVAEKTKEVIEKEEKYRFLLQNMQEGILVIGHDWKYIFANSSIIDKSIYSSDDLMGYTIMEKHPGIETKEIFKTLKHCMEQRQAQVVEYQYAFSEGSKGWLQMSIQPVPEGLLILSTDITDRKKASKEIELVNKKLEKKAAELERSNNELERFAFVASHDLQEPLRMVTSFLNLLEKRLEGQLDEPTKKFIFFAIDGAERMRTLVQDLLEYSRVGTNIEDFKTTDINDVMQYIKRVLEINLKQKNATLIVDPMPVVTVNKALISLLFLNLISNALKYHGSLPPEVKVGCIENADETIFYVKDKGIGIDAKFFDKIFIIFQRLHTKDQYDGTGMGLAICKKITDIHHGNIWVESAIGMGSTFYFSIPKQKPDLEAIL